MGHRRVRFALASSFLLAACGLDITGQTTNDLAPTGDAGGDALASGRDGATTTSDGGGDDDDDGSAASDAGPDATVDAAAPATDAGAAGTVVAQVATNVLNGIAVTPDGNDLYVARAGDGVLHASLKAGAPLPDTIAYANDAHAIAWADDIHSLLFTRQNDIGRYVTSGALANDDHGGESGGVDIAYVSKHMVGTFTAPKVNTYDPTTATISFLATVAPSTLSPLATPAGIAVDTQSVYWADSGKDYVGKASITGIGATQLVTGLTAPTSVAVDGANLYIAQADSIVATSSTIPGAAKTPLATGLSSPISLVFAGGRVYWLEATGTLKRYTVTGPATGALDVLSAGTAITNLTHQHLIAVAGPNVLWGNPTDGTVRRLNVGP